jgi:HD-GYP domain-containing protein (c-di-GMP phosphodiesterase class II)
VESRNKRLRITTRFQEIYDILFKSVERDGCFIWKSSDKTREKFPVSIVSIADNQTTVVVRQKNLLQGINPNESIYLKLNLRDSAIKTRVVERVGPKIVLEFPSQLALEEGRKNPRFYFHPSEAKSARIRTSAIREKALPERIHSVLVCDVSRGGIAIFIPNSLKAYFDVKSKVTLMSLGIQKFDQFIRGEVLFKIPYEIKGTLADKAGFKLGISFERELDDATIDRFVSKRNLFSITEEQIVRDEEFRKEVVSSMNQIRKTVSGRKNFKDLFAAFERTRAKNHYLKQHVHLLCQVLAGVGTRLGWISERSIDKLIYVAYLHDIRFAKSPHLARIQSKAEFEKIRTTLSEDDQKAFLEAPVYAADLARQDLESYPDAIKMLLQQKELPDGSGFPHGLTSSQIAPLSALFIVAHYFVDYVIDHPDWSAEDFVKTYQSRLKGQYFQKIFQAIRG